MPSTLNEPALATAQRPAFGPHGRLVPAEGEAVYSQVDRRYFSLAQPPLDFVAIHARLVRHLTAGGTSLPSAGDFASAATRLRERIEADACLGGLFTGVHVPFLLPARAGADADIGAEMDAVLLPAVGRSYLEKLPGFEFRNYCQGQLAGHLRIQPGVRYERLVERHAREPLVGWYFPGAFAGYAIPEQRRVIARLPEQVSLAGPLEVAAAFVGTPDLLMRLDNYPNLLAMSAVCPPDPKMFHFFEAYGWNLTYNQRSMIGAVSEYFAGGATILA
jgi:hypothetical protein